MGIGSLTRAAIFLDRDGVINQALVREGKPYPPPNLAAMTMTPGVKESLVRLKAAGFLLIVVTNQPDVSRGKQTREAVEEIHAHLGSVLPIDAFQTCYHDDSADCLCRKPKPGLLLDAAAEFNIDLASSYMVGDRWRDVDAGASAGCQTVWIDYGYQERGPSAPPNFRVTGIAEAVEAILAAKRREEEKTKEDISKK